MTTPVDLKEVRVSMMNVVHDLALLVARDEGLFRDEGLEVEIVSTPGTSQVNADHQALQTQIFDRTMEALYNTGAVDQYRMCEWGVMSVPWRRRMQDSAPRRSAPWAPPCPRWPSSWRPAVISTNRSSSKTLR